LENKAFILVLCVQQSIQKIKTAKVHNLEEIMEQIKRALKLFIL